MNATSKTYVIASGFRTSVGKQRYKISPINGITKSVVSPSQLKEITLKPAVIHVEPLDVDAKVLMEMLSRETLQKIWSGDIDNAVTYDQRFALY